MSNTRRYWIVNADGRRFCVEPLHDRTQKANDVAFRNGGRAGSGVKNETLGGSIRPEESTITAGNGFPNITELPPGVSPEDWIEHCCARPRP